MCLLEGLQFELSFFSLALGCHPVISFVASFSKVCGAQTEMGPRSWERWEPLPKLSLRLKKLSLTFIPGWRSWTQMIQSLSVCRHCNWLCLWMNKKPKQQKQQQQKIQNPTQGIPGPWSFLNSFLNLSLYLSVLPSCSPQILLLNHKSRMLPHPAWHHYLKLEAASYPQS